MSSYHKLKETVGGIEQLVDVETGEIKLAIDPNKYQITSIAQREAFKKKLEFEIRKRTNNWVACYHETIKELPQKITLEELGTLFLLLPYMNFKKQGQLTMKGERMELKHIEKAISKSRRRTIEIVSDLVDVGVLEREREGKKVFHNVAPAFHTIGRTNHGYFTKTYQQFVLTLKNKYDLTIQLAGVLYAILPYFHYSTFMLCTNPNEADEQKVDPITPNELSELLNIPVKTVYKHMNGLVLRGVIVKSSARGVNLYRVNPDLMYRMDFETEHTKTVRAEFEKIMHLYQKQKNDLK